MNGRLVGVLTLGIVVSCGITGVLVACKTDPSEASEEDAGNPSSSTSSSSGNGDNGTTSSTSSSSSSSSSSTSSSSGGGPDAGDGGGTTGTVVSTPGKIACASTECDAGTTRCCWPDIDAAAATCLTTCEGNNTFEFTCDETADCDNGQKCCLGFGIAQCRDNCQGGSTDQIQLCRTDAECGDAGTCAAKQCARGTGQDTVLLPLRVCGTPTDCK